jgi:type III restriction enzyme
MALHPDFPSSPYDVLEPDTRWFPADESLRKTRYEHLIPPLVARLRKEVQAWRDGDYAGASDTSIALLNWWFKREHLVPQIDGTSKAFRYYYAQREAVETAIYLYEVVGISDKHDMMRFDSSGAVSADMFNESWRRFVLKLATGSGKTKVLSLMIAWSFFHKTYEEDSTLARNFLLIAPNIIVLDRLRTDFDGLKIFFDDPVLPRNGHEGRNWEDDFQLTLHIQDKIGVVRKTGNLFLTNIHRVYENTNKSPSVEDDDLTDFFLGSKPVAKTTDSKVNLEDIVRSIDELVVLNDEAHHIHDDRLAWFKSIQDIHNKLLMKEKFLSLQLDVTATPKHNNGAIFVQTVSDYPLVEAIHQNVVKRPVLPDAASRAKLQERQSSKFTDKYRDYLHLGYLEWKKSYEEHIKLNKKAVLFVMTDDTKNCDEVAHFLEGYPELNGSVLVIHTKNNGEISESSTGKNKDELERLRKASNEIDSLDSPYKAIVSVLMLKEGWDVKNVTAIVGLRAYSAKSNILPEQTLGRGLRRMYRGEDVQEYVSIIGTDAFMEFVESIKSEGVELERRAMGDGARPIAPVIVEVDKENVHKDIEALDIEIPVLTPRIYREYKNISEIALNSSSHNKIEYKTFSEEEKREIVFKEITTGETSHTTEMDGVSATDFSSVVGFFAREIMREMRLVTGYDLLYPKVYEFISQHLFSQAIDLDDLNTLRNLSEPVARQTITQTFKKLINELTVMDRGEAEIKDYIKISRVRPFVTKEQEYVTPKKSVFNRIVGDSRFELEFANFLDGCGDVSSHAKNYFACNFRIDYIDADGTPSNYYPDFFVKVSEKEIWLVETKGREDLDDPRKYERLKQWCEDTNRLSTDVVFDCVLVRQEDFEKYTFRTFKALCEALRA